MCCAWRGAALSVGSSIRWQQAAPGNDPAREFTPDVWNDGAMG
jgi:hypothetical protein